MLGVQNAWNKHEVNIWMVNPHSMRHLLNDFGVDWDKQ